MRLATLVEMAERMYGDLVKADVDVDVERRVLVVDMELHADGETALLEAGSRQEDIWGINLYPRHFGGDDFIEFDSMINICPRQENRTSGGPSAHLRDCHGSNRAMTGYASSANVGPSCTSSIRWGTSEVRWGDCQLPASRRPPVRGCPGQSPGYVRGHRRGPGWSGLAPVAGGAAQPRAVARPVL
ncbi:MAG: DUF5674 family protein [Acidimicrobiales bacterium]